MSDARGPSAPAEPGSDSRVALLAELGIPAVATDLDGTICPWNRHAADLYGRAEDEMLGAPVSTVALSLADDAIAGATVAELLRVGRWRGEIEIDDARGRPLRLEVRATVLVDGADRPIGFEAAFADLSERLAAERRELESESRLRVAQRIGGVGSWEWDPREDRLAASDMFASLLGLDPGGVVTMDVALAAIPVPDRTCVRSALERMRSAGADSISVEYRVEGRDGEHRWLEDHGSATRDQQGALTLVSGTTRDVTARVQADDRLREAGALWQATLDSLAAHIAILDEDGAIVAVNSAWRRFAESEGGESDYVGSNYIAVCEAATDPLGGWSLRGSGRYWPVSGSSLSSTIPATAPRSSAGFCCVPPGMPAQVRCAWL